MSLTTQCPKCATAFRVHANQLSARGGRVRCGRCAHVFDGVARLVQDAPAAPSSREPSPQLALFEDSRQHADAGIPGLSREARAAADSATAGKPEPPVQTPPAAAAQPSAPAPRVRSSGALARSSVEDAIGSWDEGERPRYRLLWTLLAALATLALAAQTSYWFRTEISILLPESRPYLEAACEVADCSIGLPRHADLLSIESSDLQTDPQRGNLIVLTALLRNRAKFPQEYPALELTLTDEGDRALVRKVLKPADYLDARLSLRAAAQGIGGGSETPVRVHFDASQVRATGYRLYLFYP